MTDRFESMSILVAAVDCGSLSAAATRLRMPLATVSRRVAELEERLDTRLLQRSARGLTLTEPGEVYLAACRRILEQLDEAERLAAGEFTAPKGTLTLTAPIVFGRKHVLPVLTEFLRLYPDVDVRLELSDRPVSLLEEHLDAAVRIGHLPDSSLRARRLGQVRKVVCGSPEYLEKHGRPSSPEDLMRHQCVTFYRLTPIDRWSFGEGRRHRQVRIRPRLVVNTAEAAIDAAASGLGLTRVLSYQVAEAVREGRLEILLASDERTPLPVSILHANGPVAQKLRAFVDFAAPRLEAVLAG